MNLQTERAIARILNGFTLKNLNPFLPRTLLSYICFTVVFSVGYSESYYVIIIQIILMIIGAALFYKRL